MLCRYWNRFAVAAGALGLAGYGLMRMRARRRS